MAALTPFNPDDVTDDREIIAAGNYPAQIIESSLAETRTGGTMLKLTWEILDGPAKGRRVWENLNIVNPNVQAEEIAKRSLKRICDAVGFKGVLTDSEVLHFKPVELTVAIEPPKGEYGEKNIVKGYKAYGSAPSAPPPSAAPSKPWGAKAA